MRHRVSHRKLGRVTEHRIALLRNQAEALIRHERIETTIPKAKELRPFVERLITIAKRGLAGGEANGKSLHARRMVLRDIQDRDVVGKLFDTIAPRFETRPGGYTRILRIGYRRGDSAEVAQIELVGSEFNPNAETEKADAASKAKPQGVGGRLRAAAERLRGKKAQAAEEGAEDATAENKAKPKREAKGPKGGGRAATKGKAAQTRAPRKAGGS
jgi:large subunit ribosomal protein L17